MSTAVMSFPKDQSNFKKKKKKRSSSTTPIASSSTNPVDMMRLRMRTLVGDHSDGDSSTIHTQDYHSKASTSTYPSLSQSQGLEVAPTSTYWRHKPAIVTPDSRVHHHSNADPSAITINYPPPPPLPPMSLTISHSSSGVSREDEGDREYQGNEIEYDDENDLLLLVEPPEIIKKHHAHHTNPDKKLDIPAPIPPPPFYPHDSGTTVPISNLPGRKDLSSINNPKKANQSSAKQQQQQQQPKQQSASPIWKQMFQRCVGDCYCLPHSTGTANRQHNPHGFDEPETTTMEFPSIDFQQFNFVLPGTEEVSLEESLPLLLKQIREGPAKARSGALLELSHLCDREHAPNRIPLVCSSTNQQYDCEQDTVTVLCQILLDPATSLNDYRQALLILSNLTLPLENKALLLLSPPHASLVLQTLYQGLQVMVSEGELDSSKEDNNNTSNDDNEDATNTHPKKRQLEMHLVCAILYNLSFLDDGKPVLLNYVPTFTDTEIEMAAASSQQQVISSSPLDNPQSLLRTMEKIMMSLQPFVAPDPNSIAMAHRRTSSSFLFSARTNSHLVEINNECNDRRSPLSSKYHNPPPPQPPIIMRNPRTVDRQTMRWTFGLLRNLVTQPALAVVVGQTQLPLVALQVLANTPHLDDWGKWHPSSLEDLALAFLVELALRQQELQQQGKTRGKQSTAPAIIAPCLHSANCREYLQPLLSNTKGGIHTLRAQAIVTCFDGDIVESSVEVTEDEHGSNNENGNGKSPPRIAMV